jgi:hypothetical protein
MQNQGVLFPTEDSGDKSFEFKRAQRAARKELTQGHVDLMVILPYTLTEKQFVVSRMSSGKWHCQACPRNSQCSHIRKLRKLLQIKTEAGYIVPDKEWLDMVLPIGQIK